MRYPSKKAPKRPVVFALLICAILSSADYLGPAAIADLKKRGLNAERVQSQISDSRLAVLEKVAAVDGGNNDRFGNSVSVSGDIAVIGASGDDNLLGSASVYERVDGVWSFRRKLQAHDHADFDNFGSSVAVSGSTIIVGAALDDDGSKLDQGSAYVFVKINGDWSFQQKLTAQDGAINDNFGVSVSLRGDTALVGAYSDDIGANPNQGSAYIFERQGTVWTERQKLTASNGGGGDQFGNSVSLSGDSALVGAPLTDSGQANQGSAYVFVRSGTFWIEQKELRANDGQANDFFGTSVAISGDTALIGAFGDDRGSNVDEGSAYVFDRTGTTWSEPQKLVGFNGNGSKFGNSVALNGNRALIGAVETRVGTQFEEQAGSVSLFLKVGTLWLEAQQLSAPRGATGDEFGFAVTLSGDTAFVGAPRTRNGANLTAGAVFVLGCGYVEYQRFEGIGLSEGDTFGHAVAISGDTAVVGAPFDDVGMTTSVGSAYVFIYRGGQWTQQAQLFASDGALSDLFGSSVAISGDVIVVGAPLKKIGTSTLQGAAYVFVRSGTTWTQQPRLTALDGKDSLRFGTSVAIDSTSRIAVGADAFQAPGEVYLFTRTGTSWTQERKITATDGAADNELGQSVALSGDFVVAGAPGAQIGQNSSQGAVYIFNLGATTQASFQRKLIAPDGERLDSFGASVAISGNTVLVGAPDDGRAPEDVGPGAAYVFLRSGGVNAIWTQQAKLELTDGLGLDAFGVSVGLSGDTAVVGARGRDFRTNTNRGAAYVFLRKGTMWTLEQELIANDGSTSHELGSSIAVSSNLFLAGAPIRTNMRGSVYSYEYNCSAAAAVITSVSAASFASGGELAPESIVAGFGRDLAPGTQTASVQPLPQTMLDGRVRVTDSGGNARFAPLFFVSPGQINYQYPTGTATGQSSIAVSSGDETIAEGTVFIANVAPGLFAANANGRGVAAALALRIKADGTQLFEQVARFDAAQNRFVAIPVDLGPPSDQVFLVLFGTGLRFRSSLAGVSLTIGGTSVQVLFAGEAPGFVGLDQVNAHLPRSLIGRNEIDVALSLDGRVANVVRVNIH